MERIFFPTQEDALAYCQEVAEQHLPRAEGYVTQSWDEPVQEEDGRWSVLAYSHE